MHHAPKGTMMGLRKNVSYLNRYRQIVHVMTKHGLGYFVEQMGLTSMVPRTKRKDIAMQRPRGSLAATYRVILEELGPTFIKFGQILSTRPDIVSPEYVQEFSKLQDSVPPLPFSVISAQMERELSAPLETVFASVDEEPIASASIGQVHKGVLRTGETVAVKVQKPDIERTVSLDLEIMRNLARRVGTLAAQRSPYEPEEIVDEFAKAIRKELDYTLEARNAEKFYREFEKERSVRIPRIFRQHSTKRLLVMEYIEGRKVLDILGDARYTKEERAHIAKIGADALYKMIFVHGFFHADPHPANIFVIDAATISFLDFGIVGRINSRMRDNIVDLVLGVVERDAERIADTVIEITGAEEVGKDELVWEIDDLVDQYYGQTLENVNMGQFIQDLTTVAKRHRLKMPKHYTLLSKAILMIEGIGRQLDPSFDALSHSRPYVETMVRERMKPSAMARRWYASITQAGELLLDLPKRVDTMVTRLSKRGFKIGVERDTIDALTHSFERSVNRLSFAIVSASMVLASAVLLQADVGPHWKSLPLVGLALFAVSFLFGVSLLNGIFKSGKL